MAQNTSASSVRIGGASGFWGDSDSGLPQLLKAGGLDYVVFDYLAEITMSILARARAKSPELGYATDFVTDVVKPYAAKAAKAGVKLLSNAGGVNPEACAAAIRAALEEQGLDLKVAVVTGDDLTSRAAEFADRAEMFSGAPFPDPTSVASANAYLGGFPIAAALDAGADIVVTGRCVDSALTLGACIHAFGWGREDWDRLAGGSLAGHLLECGTQATGGNFTDWELVEAGLDEAGYPIADIRPDGGFRLTKPAGTGGAVTRGAAAEQLVYEIGDPGAYLLPDVACDFTEVSIAEVGADEVEIVGAKGRPAPRAYKTSVTFQDGWKIAMLFGFVGDGASAKAQSFARAALARTERKLARSNAGGFDEVSVERLGDESQFGAFARPLESREIMVKISAKHANPKALSLLLKEATGLALSAPPGLTLAPGARPKPSPVVRLFSFLVDKNDAPVEVRLNGEDIGYAETPPAASADAPPKKAPAAAQDEGEMVSVPLRRLAWARSGDKGDKANIGVIARDPSYAPWIWRDLTEAVVAERFAHFLKGEVERFYMPGLGAVNFLLHDVLGGGGIASLRADPQGKAYGQILLDAPISIPSALLKEG